VVFRSAVCTGPRALIMTVFALSPTNVFKDVGQTIVLCMRHQNASQWSTPTFFDNVLPMIPLAEINRPYDGADPAADGSGRPSSEDGGRRINYSGIGTRPGL